MFNSIKKHFQRIYEKCTISLSSLFSKKIIDETVLDDLSRILLEADTGTVVTQLIIRDVRNAMHKGEIVSGEQLQAFLTEKLIQLFPQKTIADTQSVIFLIGVNGAGKTTCIAKLAHVFQQQGKKILVCAADTYRAAAQEQIKTWCDQMHIDCVEGKSGEDPAAVVFKSCKQFDQNNYDILLIDTSGRLPNAAHLMRLLAKMIQVAQKQLPNCMVQSLIVLDALIGQSSLDQAKQFMNVTPLHGALLTKMDSSSKGGVVFSLAYTTHIPILFTTHGEKKEDITIFKPHEYVHGLLNS